MKCSFICKIRGQILEMGSGRLVRIGYLNTKVFVCGSYNSFSLSSHLILNVGSSLVLLPTYLRLIYHLRSGAKPDPITNLLFSSEVSLQVFGPILHLLQAFNCSLCTKLLQKLNQLSYHG